MLKEAPVAAMPAAGDMARVKAFYSEALGPNDQGFFATSRDSVCQRVSNVSPTWRDRRPNMPCARYWKRVAIGAGRCIAALVRFQKNNGRYRNARVRDNCGN